MKKEFDSNSSVSQQSNHLNERSGLSRAPANSANDQSLRELQQSIIAQIKRLPGNDCCVDCGSTKDPTWLSVNFGVLTVRHFTLGILAIFYYNLTFFSASSVLVYTEKWAFTSVECNPLRWTMWAHHSCW